MTTPVVLTLLGFGLGALIMAGGRSDPREQASLRDQAIEAQRFAERAARRARELAARWSGEASARERTDT